MGNGVGEVERDREERAALGDASLLAVLGYRSCSKENKRGGVFIFFFFFESQRNNQFIWL